MQDATDPRDVAGDIPGDVTWLSYAELGRLRGISAASAKRLSNRRRWRKRPGNDGTTRVAVPVEAAGPHETDPGDISGVSARHVSRDILGDVRWDVPTDISGDIVTLQVKALAALEVALTAANARAEEALALADRLGAQLADAGNRADRAEARTVGLEADLRAKGAELEALRCDAEAARRGAEVALAELAGARLAADQARAEVAEARLVAGAWQGAQGDAVAGGTELQAELDQARREAQEAAQTAEALRTAMDELKAGQAHGEKAHAAELVAAQKAARAAEEMATALRQAEEARKGGGACAAHGMAGGGDEFARAHRPGRVRHAGRLGHGPLPA